MSQSSRKREKRQRRVKQDDFLQQLNTLYGNTGQRRDVFGRRAALPSEIARHLQAYPMRQTMP